ncbi:MAG: response regulator [Deltaproteobacteria bacterium]|jgi:PAS domain S-box-containing protein|nr:response regulator [Deltaproteobacteria bacterium]
MKDQGKKNSPERLTLESLANNLFLSGIGLWELELSADNVDSAEIAVSDSFLLLLGNKEDNPHKKTMSLKEYIENWVHPDELEHFLAGLDELIQGKNDHYELEHRLFCYNREEWRWVNLNCEILKDAREDPRTLVFAGVVQDIHVKRLARQALTKALQEKETAGRALALEQKRLSAVLDAANLGTWDLDLTTGEVVYSPKWAASMGYELPELGKTLKDRSKFVLAKDLERANEALEAHITGKTPFHEADYRTIKKDGSMVWTQERGRVVEFDGEGKPSRLLGVMLDVTRQKETEQTLKENKEQMELFFEAAAFGSWDWDVPSGRIRYNHIFYDLLGYRPGELSETIDEWESLVHPEDEPAANAALEMCLSGDVQVYACEMRMRHKDGHYVWTYDLGRVVERDENGRATRLMGGHFDFSEKKKLEQDIFKMIEQEREARLARELAEESARAKSEFLANMSHEIRTPMNAILGLNHLILESAELSEQHYEYHQRINTAAKALLRIINDILDFSKIEAGKLEMEMAVFNLDILAAADMKLHSAQAANKGLALTLDIDPEVPRYLRGDQVRLGQVINNLLSNAIKFTEKGGVTVKVELKERIGDEALLKFAVSDTGIGLSEEQAKNLFSPFTQADTSITRKYGGTGLGLTISKRLVELMGGTIWVESDPGKGATFSFTVKLKMSDKPPETVDAAAVSFDSLEILAVDDNITALELIRQALAKQGVKNVTTLSSGDEAIQYLKNERKKPDLIMVDWKMPGIDGIETIRRINEIAQVVKSSLIVMVTAYNRDEILSQAKSLGVKKVLTKPLTESYLHDCLMDLFGKMEKVAHKQKKSKGEEVQAIKGARILLVEDNEVNQLVASKILTNAGFEVTIAGDGQKAVDTIQKDTFDLILMDIQMPVMDGLTAARTIRELGCPTPIVAMTAHAMSSDRDLSLKAGMVDHVNKPINVKELFRTLSKWIPPKNVPVDSDPAPAPMPNTNLS